MLSSCYRNAHGVIVVFDVTSEKSFQNLPQWLKEIDEFSSAAAAATNKQRMLPKLLIGNKCELEDRRQVKTDRAEKYAAENDMQYIETSAISTVNVREAFIKLIKEDKQK